MASLRKTLHFLIFISVLFLICLLPPSTVDADTLSFNFPSFGANQTDIEFKGDARYFGTPSSIYLTHLKPNSSGRAMHRQPMQLWLVDDGTTRLADFTTRFSFMISKIADYANAGEGLTFLIVPDNATWTPNGDVGDLLGLFESGALAQSGAAGNQVVAVEFDNAQNKWDPSKSHLGIDVNSIESETYRNVEKGFEDRSIVDALVTYDSAAKNLSALMTFELGSLSYNVSHIIDLSTVLPQRVQVGFSAATSSYVEIHQLLSWSFDSRINGTGINGTRPNPPTPGTVSTWKWVAGLVGLVAIASIIGVALYCLLCKRNAVPGEEPLVVDVPSSVEDQEVPSEPVFPDDVAPKRFSYQELFEATEGFSEEHKLGSGGFGDVYGGNLPSSNKRVAIKKFKNGSTQGESEYFSEVNVISRLKHRNLVQLEGWCHEKNELLLVYEFMPNRSLDLHLFGQDNFSISLLTWPIRYNVALGLASALNYLQNESNQCVIHRDIKSSNIMLDQDFNAKLGDFGLARLTDHGKSFNPSTGLAGTPGYLAPELIRWEKPTKASDVYSFGVVALELATGEKAILSRNETRYSLVDWVWDKHKIDAILEEAVDERVKNSADFNEAEAMRLVMIGLACCHSEARQRPTIEQVKYMLKSLAVDAPDGTSPSVDPRTANDAGEAETQAFYTSGFESVSS